MNFKVRDLLKDAVITAFENHVNKALGNQSSFVNAFKVAPGLTPSCINCHFFNEADEICRRANSRPPARIIALGCEQWSDLDDIPF